MRDKTLLCITQVTEDDSGVWAPGDLTHSVHHTCDEFLKLDKKNREKLAKLLANLAELCRRGETPFWPHSGGPNTGLIQTTIGPINTTLELGGNKDAGIN